MGKQAWGHAALSDRLVHRGNLHRFRALLYALVMVLLLSQSQLDPFANPPQDIDIALDNLLGREFADRINEYLKAHVRLAHESAREACA